MVANMREQSSVKGQAEEEENGREAANRKDEKKSALKRNWCVEDLVYVKLYLNA